MYDISQFFKLLKQRFSIWYNRRHNRIGPLWCERFGSTLLEAGSTVREMCTYVDLNCVRAGIVKDPKDYQFCGYAEAVAGNELARGGLMSIGLAAEGDWPATQAAYRVALFSIGSGPRKRGAIIPQEDYREVVAQRGELPLTVRWSARVRHFTSGAVLGSRIFVEEHLAKYRKRQGPCPRTRPRSTPIEGIMSLKNPRCTATG
jgi:putative transposase